jgi:hypothetical protein
MVEIDPLIARLRSMPEEGRSIVFAVMFDAAVRMNDQPFFADAVTLDKILRSVAPSPPALHPGPPRRMRSRIVW